MDFYDYSSIQKAPIWLAVKQRCEKLDVVELKVLLLFVKDGQLLLVENRFIKACYDLLFVLWLDGSTI